MASCLVGGASIGYV